MGLFGNAVIVSEVVDGNVVAGYNYFILKGDGTVTRSYISKENAWGLFAKYTVLNCTLVDGKSLQSTLDIGLADFPKQQKGTEDFTGKISEQDILNLSLQRQKN